MTDKAELIVTLLNSNTLQAAKDLPNGQQLTMDKFGHSYQVAVWNKDQTNHWLKEFDNIDQALAEYHKFAS